MTVVAGEVVQERHLGTLHRAAEQTTAELAEILRGAYLAVHRVVNQAKTLVPRV